MGDVTVVVHSYTAAFLTAVLQGIKSVIRGSGTVACRVIDSENAAFLADCFILNHRIILSLVDFKVIHSQYITFSDRFQLFCKLLWFYTKLCRKLLA